MNALAYMDAEHVDAIRGELSGLAGLGAAKKPHTEQFRAMVAKGIKRDVRGEDGKKLTKMELQRRILANHKAAGTRPLTGKMDTAIAVALQTGAPLPVGAEKTAVFNQPPAAPRYALVDRNQRPTPLPPPQSAAAAIAQRPTGPTLPAVTYSPQPMNYTMGPAAPTPAPIPFPVSPAPSYDTAPPAFDPWASSPPADPWGSSYPAEWNATPVPNYTDSANPWTVDPYSYDPAADPWATPAPAVDEWSEAPAADPWSTPSYDEWGNPYGVAGFGSFFKKIGKTIGKVAKAAAPVALPLAASFIPGAGGLVASAVASMVPTGGGSAAAPRIAATPAASSTGQAVLGFVAELGTVLLNNAGQVIARKLGQNWQSFPNPINPPSPPQPAPPAAPPASAGMGTAALIGIGLAVLMLGGKDRR